MDDGGEGTSYYATSAQDKEEDEIEAVLTHQRDEEKLEDPEDLWFDNIVGLVFFFFLSVFLSFFLFLWRRLLIDCMFLILAFPYQMEEFLPSP